jgi:S-adenosylmethionine decarboxylase
MEDATKISGATIVKSIFHLFNAHGASGVVVTAELHLAIHTWPEYGYAAIDLFTCSEDIDPWKAYTHMKEKLGAGDISTVEMKRGQLDLLGNEITNGLD